MVDCIVESVLPKGITYSIKETHYPAGSFVDEEGNLEEWPENTQYQVDISVLNLRSLSVLEPEVPDEKRLKGLATIMLDDVKDKLLADVDTIHEMREEILNEED